MQKKFLFLGSVFLTEEAHDQILESYRKKGADYIHYSFSKENYKFPWSSEQEKAFRAIEDELVNPSALFPSSLVIEFKNLEDMPLALPKKKEAEPARSFCQASIEQKSFYPLLFALIEKAPSTASLVFSSAEPRIQKLSSFWQKMVSAGMLSLKVLAEGPGPALQWAKAKAKAWGLEISPVDLEKLVHAKDSNLSQIQQELSKIRFAAFLHLPVDEATMAWILQKTSQQKIFKILDAILDKKLDQTLLLFQSLIAEDKNEIYAMFGLLSAKWRRFLKLRQLEKEFPSLEKLANQLQQPSWLIEKELASAKKLSEEALESLLFAFSDQDLELKFFSASAPEILTKLVLDCLTKPRAPAIALEHRVLAV